MNYLKPEFLSHLVNLPKDISGYKTCTYLMALEGWRRGLHLKFRFRNGIAIPPSIQVVLSNESREHVFVVSRGDKVTKEAIRICMDKSLTYKNLKQNKVPIPEGRSFYEESDDNEIVQYAKEIGFPLVIKPTDSSSGRGVITGINDIDKFTDSLNQVRNILGFKNVIVERFFIGEDYRVYVLDNEVVGVYKRLAANVIGDGEKNIKNLIYEKNIVRKMNPFIRKREIKINSDLIEYLSLSNLTLESIPAKGERIYLRSQGAYLKERDPVDITDEISEKIKSIAVNAMNSIPGLSHCDVDMLVNEETGEAVVNEINSRPQISNHLFPMEGKARDIPKKIIDYYFPETIDSKRNDMFYFDFKPVFQSFKSKGVKEISISDIPFDHEFIRFRLKGNIKNTNYEKWLKKHVIKLRMHGYLKYLENDEISIVLSGRKERINGIKKIITEENPENTWISNVRVLSRNTPIKIGFEIYKNEKNRADKEIRNGKFDDKKHVTKNKQKIKTSPIKKFKRFLSR